MPSTKKILLLGASGLLSSAALSVFSKKGFELTVISRGKRPLPKLENLTILKADRKDFDSLSKALENKKFDFTADFLAYDEKDIKDLFSVKNFFTERYCMISSGQVYLVTKNQTPPFSEEDFNKELMAEPSKPSRDWDNWFYGMGKRRAELALEKIALEKNFNSLALRLPVVQGEKDGENSKRLWAWLERMKDKNPVLLPDGGENLVRFIYSQDVSLFLESLALGHWPKEKALNLSQKEDIKLKDFLSLAASFAGLKPEFISVKAEILAKAKIPEFCYPYWGKWTSRPNPHKAISSYLAKPRSPSEYLPSVVKAHFDNPPSSHEGYAFRKKELELLRDITK